MNIFKRISIVLLALALAASLWGCASSGDPDETTRTPDTTQAPSTTVPEVTVEFEEVTDPDNNFTIGAEPFDPLPGNLTGVDTQTAQLRIHTVDSSWQNAFNQENGCFAVASGVKELHNLAESKLAGFDLDLSAYDEAFFAENRLVLIPRSSNSGSVSYQAKLNVDGGNVHIELDARMPEIGTSDMAEFLVLVALPNEEYGDMTITVPVAAGNTGTVTK